MPLTPEQSDIVAFRSGPARVVAVAGSGKTTTFVEMVAERLISGMDPKRILVVMFNKSAQVDFESRLAQRLPNQILPEVRTFHSLALRMYKRLASIGACDARNWNPMPSYISDRMALKAILESVHPEQQRDIQNEPSEALEAFWQLQEHYKSGFDNIDIAFEKAELSEKWRSLLQAHARYEEVRQDAKLIGFSDMLYDSVNIIDSEQHWIEHFANHMDLVLVDEYQDINAIQQRLVEIIAGNRAQVIAVGDPDQTIYEFRGSSPSFMLRHFDSAFPNSQQLPLTTTFRYGYPLALAANQLIAHNRNRHEHFSIPASKDAVTQINPIPCVSDQAAALTHIEQLLSNSRSAAQPQTIAVLCRLWSNAAPIELALMQRGIDFSLHGGNSVLTRRELQIITGLLEVNQRASAATVRNDSKFWRQLMTTPHLKIKQNIIDGVALQLANSQGDFSLQIRALANSLNGWEKKQLHSFAGLIADLERPNTNAKSLINRFFVGRGYLEALRESATSKQRGDESVAILQAFTDYLGQHRYPPAEALQAIYDLQQQRAQGVHNNQISLTTIHRAKGLEWDHVIVSNFDDEHFPYQHGNSLSAAAEESERRLAYVAITRAKLSCSLLVPKGAGENLPSRFQAELGLTQANRWREVISGAVKNLTLSKPQHAAWSAFATHQDIDLPKVEEAKEQPKGPPRAGVKALPAVIHSHYGYGEIVHEDRVYITIRFRNERERTFSKKAATALIERLS